MPHVLPSACDSYTSSDLFSLGFPPSVKSFGPPIIHSRCHFVVMTSSTPVQSVTTVYRTRSILGPLTTVYNAPLECALAGVAGTPLSIAFRGQTRVGDSLADESGCWPAATAAAPSASTPLDGWGFYSPGISCPAGYTTACDATQGYRTGWQMQFTMEEGETAVGCCPT